MEELNNMFKIQKEIGKKRIGILRTKNGILKTPFFMPDATRGFVKLTNNDELKKAGINAMVVNTFHLYLQPGMVKIKKAKGIHGFMDWKGPLLSDSGGFQVFSLIHQNPKMGKISDEAASFVSPLNGSKHILTPEKSIQIQFDMGVDMMVCLDDCPPNESNRGDMEKAVNRTIAWARRSKDEYDRQVRKRNLRGKQKPLLFSVIQGGTEFDMREKCARALIAMDFDGYGFGARPIDKDGNFLRDILQFTADLIPKNRLRFALGIGKPEDIWKCAAMGWDMFDCVIPTREGRHGRLFSYKTSTKRYKTENILNSKFIHDFSPINKKSKIPQLRNYTKACLNHLFKMKEPLGQQLVSLNNLEIFTDMMEEIRGGK